MLSHPTATLRYLVILGWGAPDRIQTIEEEDAHGLKQTARQSEHYVQISKGGRPPQSDTDQRTSRKEGRGGTALIKSTHRFQAYNKSGKFIRAIRTRHSSIHNSFMYNILL